MEQEAGRTPGPKMGSKKGKGREIRDGPKTEQQQQSKEETKFKYDIGMQNNTV